MKYNQEILNRFLTEQVAIEVRNYAEWDKFMHLLAEESNVKWSKGANPIEFNAWHENSNNFAITCGYRQPSRLEYAHTGFYQDSGYEIIEFEELIEGEKDMEYKGQNYRDLFVKTKIEGFVNSQYQFKENFENYKGYVLSEYGYRQKPYFNFLCEMKQFGIERDEIEQIILKDHLSKKEKE